MTQHRTRTPLPTPLLIICYLLFACTTAPKVAERTLLESGVVPLDKGAAVYALVDVPNARAILEGFNYIPANDKNIKLMLDRTQSAVLAVFSPSPADDRRYQLVSWGNYPASGSRIAFGTNKNWTKKRSASLSGMVYWHSEKNQMSIAVTPSQAYVLVAMTEIPHDPISPPEGVKIPDGFGEFARGAVFSCWFSDPGPVFNRRLKGMGIPLEIPSEQLFVRLFPVEDERSASRPAYETHVKITLPSAVQARTIVSFLALARAFISSVQQPPVSQSFDDDSTSPQNNAGMLSSLLFVNPVTQEEGSLLFKIPPMSVREISLLFSMFSL